MEEKTYSLGLDQLVLGSLVLLLEADVFFVQRQHTLLDILWHVLARQRRTEVARLLHQDSRTGRLVVCKLDSPDSTLALEHPVALIDTLARQVDLLEQEPVDLLELHLVLVRELFDLSAQAVDLGLQLGFVFVDGLAQGFENIELVTVDKCHWKRSETRMTMLDAER